MENTTTPTFVQEPVWQWHVRRAEYHTGTNKRSMCCTSELQREIYVCLEGPRNVFQRHLQLKEMKLKWKQLKVQTLINAILRVTIPWYSFLWWAPWFTVLQLRLQFQWFPRVTGHLADTWIKGWCFYVSSQQNVLTYTGAHTNTYTHRPTEL